MTTRPLEIAEYRAIIDLMVNGFITTKKAVFRPNKQVALALQLEATLGLRISDVLSLRVQSFKNGKLEITEKKTGKLQYRDIHRDVHDFIKDYAIENQLSATSLLFTIKTRCVQKQLKLTTDYLGLENISTHSFRKMYATHVYDNSGNNMRLVQELLNHSSIGVTERYIGVFRQDINKASASVNFF